MRPDSDHDEEKTPEPTSFGQRHGVTIMTIVLIAMFALVLFVDSAC
jgi:hypothetical protein